MTASAAAASLLLLLLSGCSICSCLKLTDHESYRDFIPLSSANVSKLVLQDDQAWVLYIYDGEIFAEFKRLAAAVRGLVRFGLIDKHDEDAVEALQFVTKFTFRAFSFGKEKTKDKNFLDATNFAEALDFASKSVPDTKLKIIKTETHAKELLMESISAKPSKFTGIFTIRDTTPTLLQKVLAHKVSRNFNFGIVPQAADEGALSAAGFRNVQWPVPGLTILAVKNDGTVHSGRLDESKRPWDSMTYADILQFLIEFNRQYRPDLIGDNQKDDRKTRYMTDVLSKEQLVFAVSDEHLIREPGVKPDLKEEL